jgi:ring-1,2-phenylacetyl-CoA epoxidase subunit PaaC
MSNKTLFQYTLHLADNALILGQRNSEWTGHGPVLEQDIAITNISLDLLGQARHFYQYASLLYNQMNKKEKDALDKNIPSPWKSYQRELCEDDLAFLRDDHQYMNLLLLELPNGDWGKTILRQFFFSAYQFFLFQKLIKSKDPQLAAIAAKSIKEVSYHLRWSSEWVIRLGDGTEESNGRIKKSIEELWPFTGEMFIPASYEVKSAPTGFGTDITAVREVWTNKVIEICNQATLQLPETSWIQTGGKDGKHTEHLGFMLTEMQQLQRAYPNRTW